MKKVLKVAGCGLFIVLLMSNSLFAGSTNFQQFNPGAANQESDSAYTSDTTRSGGAATGAIFPSVLANKLFFQTSTMTTALAQMMVNKGYTLLDSNLANLISQLSNLITVADLPASLASPGYQIFPSGLIMQWGTVSGISGGSGSSVSLPYACPNSILMVMAGALNTGTNSGELAGGARINSNTSITVFNNGNQSANAFSWFVICY